MTMEATIDDIQSRIAICKYAIHVLEQETNDPRQPEALKEYKRQLAELEAQLKPPTVVIGLKPATLFGKVGR